jgi:hypothetical protein
MKKYLIIAMLLAATAARAFDFKADLASGQRIYYTITTPGKVKIVNPDWDTHTNPTGVMVLDSVVTHEGTSYHVIAIDQNAFRNCSDLTGVIVPEGVTSIGRMAFAFCTSLSSISLPSTLTEIGSQAFTGTAYFSNSENLTADGLLYIGNYLVAAQRTIEGTVTLNEGTLGVGNMAFYSCDQLQTLEVPSSVRFIGSQAFLDCLALDTIVMEDSVPPALGDNAFSGVEASGTVSVPCGATAAYQAVAAWASRPIVERCEEDNPDPDPDPNPDPIPNPNPIPNPPPQPVPDPQFPIPLPVDPLAIDSPEASVIIVVSAIPGGIIVYQPETSRCAVADLTGRTLALLRGQAQVQLPTGVYFVVPQQGKAKKVLVIR